MKWILSFTLATALAGSMIAEDKNKATVKSETKDPVTGDTVKHKSKTQVDSDGDFKEKSRTKVNGSTVEKRKAKGENDGDYKEKVKVKNADGKYESKTKVDK